MIDSSSEKITVERFGGSATLPDATHVRFPRALIAANQEYSEESALTRLGFGPVLSSSEPATGEIVTAMFNWISSRGNLLVWFRTSDLAWRIRNIAAGPVGTLQTIGGTAYAGSFANAGARLYAAFFTSAGRGSTFGRVICFQTRWTIAATTLVNITVASNVGTVTTSAANDFGVNALLTISGATVDLQLNGEYAVAGVTSPTVFTIATVGVADGVYTDATLSIAAYTADNLFQGPLGYVPGAPTEPAGGVITAGSHRLGYLLEFRSGFITRPSPDSGAVPPDLTSFLPVTFVATGAKNLSWALNTTWRSGAIRVHGIMSPVSNPNRFFMVPGATAAVVGGTAHAITLVFNDSDDDLFALEGKIEVTGDLNLITSSVANDAPFNPSVVFMNGDRMGYVTTILDGIGNPESAIFISDIGKYQRLALDQNMIQLPGKQDIMTAVCLADGATYVFGEEWTYRTRDNGQAPVNWPTPQLVSGNIGSPSIRGICPSADGSYCWVADHAGLYLLRGEYPELPVSDLVSPIWDRINWAVPQAVQVKDDPEKKQVYVMVCLDSATTPNYILKWNYEEGKTWDKVSFSLDSLRNSTLGSMEMVQNTAPSLPASVYKQQELWISALTGLGVSPSNYFLRSLSLDDTNRYLDLIWNIPGHYRTALLRTRSKPLISIHLGGFLRMTGAGAVSVSAHVKDGVVEWPALLIALSETPGKDFEYWMHLLGESVSYDFEVGQNDALDPGFELGLWTAGASSGAGSWANVTDTPNARTGTHYAKHTGANTVCELTDSGQTFVVVPGETYFVEVWTKSTGAPDGILSMGLEYFNSAGVSQGFLQHPFLLTPLEAVASAAYTVQGAFYVIPVGAAYVRPLLRITNKTTGVWFVDDFYFSLSESHMKLSGIQHYMAPWAMQE